jgi:hypothetical protein
MRSLKTFALLQLLTVIPVMGQITLETTYSYSATIAEIDKNEFCYFLMDVPQQQCRIYNSDHELYKSIFLSIPEGYYLYNIQFVSRKLFNKDDLIELLYIYAKYNTSDQGNYYQYGLEIINENGKSLLKLPNGGYAETKKLDDDTKLLAYTYMYNTGGWYDETTAVFSLGGDIDEVNIAKAETSPIVPNPASDKITIETKNLPEFENGIFILFDPLGREVLSSPISSQDQFEISLNGFVQGVYQYTIHANSKTIYSNSLIIR